MIAHARRLRALAALAFFVISVAGVALAAPAALLAQPAATATSAALVPDKKPPPGFERVAGAPEQEKLDPSPLVVGAYAVFFVLFFGYIIYVARSQATLARQMTELEERIRNSEKR